MWCQIKQSSSFLTYARNILVWAPSFILMFKCKVCLRIPISGVSLSFSSSRNNCASAGSTAILGPRQVLRYLYPLGEENVSTTPTSLCCIEPRSRPRNQDLRFHENHQAARKWASVSAIERISPEQNASACFHISQVLENGQIGSHSCSLCFSETQLPHIWKRNNGKT